MTSVAGRGNSFLRSWTWKREHRPDRDRFELPYKHKLVLDGAEQSLTINQRPLKSIGFASTVWDSAIVLSKYLERWPTLVCSKRCVEIGAGCGLAGIVSARLGAREVVLTDLPENLPLLRENVAVNQVSPIVSVEPLVWGSEEDTKRPPFEVVLATDVMYVVEAMDPLVRTLTNLSGPGTIVLLAYGRNRPAEEPFMARVDRHFALKRVNESALDGLYQCVDVDVFELRLRANKGPLSSYKSL